MEQKNTHSVLMSFPDCYSEVAKSGLKRRRTENYKHTKKRKLLISPTTKFQKTLEKATETNLFFVTTYLHAFWFQGRATWVRWAPIRLDTPCGWCVPWASWPTPPILYQRLKERRERARYKRVLRTTEKRANPKPCPELTQFPQVHCCSRNWPSFDFLIW